MKKLPEELVGPFVGGMYDHSLARLYLKREGGTSQVVDDVYPSLFIPTPQFNNFDMQSFPEVFQGVPHYQEEGRYIRVYMKPRTTRSKIDEILHMSNADGVFPREADVSALRRWFSDTGSLVSNKTKALFFDLETKPEVIGFDEEAKKHHRIISFSAQDLNNNRWFDYNHTNDLQGEERLIKSFLKIAEAYDTLLAWNGNDYDFYVIKWRCKKLKLEIEWRQWNLLDYMLTVKKCLGTISDPKFKRSYALDNIGQNVLGIRKLHVNCPMGQLDRLIEQDRVSELEEYNVRDTEIMIKLEEKREFLQLHLAVCSICRMFPGPGSLFPNALADGLMLRLAIQQNRHFRTRYLYQEDENENKYSGAYVMDPIIGFHEKVQVVDFSSLYPSIIISWNMSPDTKLWNNQSYPIDIMHNCATATATGVKFRTDREGMLPMALRKLLEQRKIYSKKQMEANVGTEEWKRFGHESTALKVVANSMYGLLGSQFSRYYDREIAESVTLTGQHLIKNCIHYSEGLGYKVIGGDTDSIFVIASIEKAATLIDEINKTLVPQICNESGCRQTAIRMDSDKAYHYLLIQAKKKYAGKLSLHKGRLAPDDMEPDVKGLEFQRSDQIRYAQRMQMHFLHFLLRPDADPVTVQTELRKWADEFLDKEINVDDIVITQAVKKHPDNYASITPAVRVAKQMIEDGKEFFQGIKVPYIVTKTNRHGIVTCIHADEYTGNFDRMYYWKQKILPPVSRLIEARFQNENLDELMSMMQDPGQFTFDYQDNDMRVRKPKAPKPKSRKRKVRISRTYLDIHEEHKVKTIKTLAQFIKQGKKGSRRIFLRIKLNSGDTVVISTEHYVDDACLKTIMNHLPFVGIEPRPI